MILHHAGQSSVYSELEVGRMSCSSLNPIFSNLVSLVIFHGTYLFCQSPNLLLKYGHPYPNFSHVTSWFLYFFSIIQPLKLACIFVRDKLSLLPFYVQKCCQGNNYVMSNSESLQCNFFIFDHVTFT